METIERFLKKDYCKFFTPDGIADLLVDLADISNHQSILEPSAGNGQIVKAIIRKNTNVRIECVEIQPINCLALFEIDNILFYEDDYLNIDLPNYHRIIANPPFEEDVWFPHLMKMYNDLTSGGLLVCVIPKTFLRPSILTNYCYKQWMSNKNVTFFPLENWAENKKGDKTQLQIVKAIKEP